MEKIVDPHALGDTGVVIPGLKPPVYHFEALDDDDPPEVDAFNQMIRDLRNQPPGNFHPDALNAHLLGTNVVSILFNKNHVLRKSCTEAVEGSHLAISFMTRAETVALACCQQLG
jgi:hypothetical protein